MNVFASLAVKLKTLRYPRQARICEILAMIREIHARDLTSGGKVMEKCKHISKNIGYRYFC